MTKPHHHILFAKCARGEELIGKKIQASQFDIRKN